MFTSTHRNITFQGNTQIEADEHKARFIELENRNQNKRVYDLAMSYLNIKGDMGTFRKMMGNVCS